MHKDDFVVLFCKKELLLSAHDLCYISDSQRNPRNIAFPCSQSLAFENCLHEEMTICMVETVKQGELLSLPSLCNSRFHMHFGSPTWQTGFTWRTAIVFDLLPPEVWCWPVADGCAHTNRSQKHTISKLVCPTKGSQRRCLEASSFLCFKKKKKKHSFRMIEFIPKRAVCYSPLLLIAITMAVKIRRSSGKDSFLCANLSGWDGKEPSRVHQAEA